MSNQNNNLFKRGSEWRKWDLHVHSPASHGYHGTWEQFEKQLSEAQCDVIGINDYCSVAGYKRIKERIASNDLDIRDKVLFPVVEFRMRDVLKNRHTGQSGESINFHIIFSDSIPVEKIETFIKSLRVDNSQIAEKYDDTQFLKETARVRFEPDVLDNLNKDPEFVGKFLVWLPYDEYGGIGDIDPNSDDWIKRDFIKKSDILGSSSRNQIDFFLWRSPVDSSGNPKFTIDQFEEWFKTKKPCIKGSDSKQHSYPIGQLKDSSSNPIDRFCWIKADPTFEGLKRVVREPEERVYIGTIPSKLQNVNNNFSKYIDSVSIHPTAEGTSPSWFDNVIKLNSGLIAIIGRKGSGKSALADILALLGRTYIEPKDYSFLKHDKFRKGIIATQYNGTLAWKDASELTDYCLNNDVDTTTELERVRYLPQVYVDRLCDEVGVSDKFQTEIDKVVFSYLPRSERQGSSSLSDLIAKRTSAIDAELSTMREQLERLINERITLEKKKHPSYKDLINNKLKDVQKEVNGIVLPKEVKKPSSEPDKATKDKVDSLKDQLEKVENEISEAEIKLDNVTKRRTSIQNIQGHIKNLSRQVEVFKGYIAIDLKALGITLDDILTYEIKREKLDEFETGVNTEINDLNITLGHVVGEELVQDDAQDKKKDKKRVNLAQKKSGINKELNDITEKLSGEQKAYEAYLVAKAGAEKRKSALTGKEGDTSLTTIVSLESELKYIDDQLDTDLAAKQKEIADISSSIFDIIASKCDTYKSIYKPLRDFVEQEKSMQEQAQSILTFDVGIVCNKDRFVNQFLGSIDHGRKGSFQGVKKGRDRIVAMLQQRSFRTKESVNTFLEILLDSLEFDRSVEGDVPAEIDDQLVQNASKPDLLKWLYGLQYLDVQYKVQFNGKDLNAVEFSPGERGAILLIFYLLIDKENIPLIIDQPEENLDNESVFILLVPYIKRAKQNRQIIIVTHNPNLAVVCDAEQVICASMDKSTNEIRYTSGSIEHPSINQRIIDVLEGTMPAFRTRDGAYQNKKS